MPSGLKDKVAILGMGCSRFGERWDVGPEELMVEAYSEALTAAGIDPTEIDAAWYSSHYDDIGAGKAGLPMAQALRLPNIGVTRVENFCAGGTEAFRGAVMAVASGAAPRLSKKPPPPTRLRLEPGTFAFVNTSTTYPSIAGACSSGKRVRATGWRDASTAAGLELVGGWSTPRSRGDCAESDASRALASNSRARANASFARAWSPRRTAASPFAMSAAADIAPRGEEDEGEAAERRGERVGGDDDDAPTAPTDRSRGSERSAASSSAAVTARVGASEGARRSGRATPVPGSHTNHAASRPVSSATRRAMAPARWRVASETKKAYRGAGVWEGGAGARPGVRAQRGPGEGACDERSEGGVGRG